MVMLFKVFTQKPVVALALAGTSIVTLAQSNNTLGGLDADGNGLISRQEALAAQKRAFERLDANRDGTVSRTEFNARVPTPGNDKKDEKAEARRTAARNAQFRHLDSDGSGDITRAEYQAAMTPYFGRLDTNGDGAIDGKELRAGFARPQR